MPSIINGLFSGRSGISSHGTAIAVVGDNISNASTPGFKSSRAEFQDLIAGGQTSGKVVGSGSQNSAVSNLMEQGTMEFTGRTLDMAIDGNGFFAVADGAQRFYSRAGNFKLDSAGFIVNQNGLAVLGYPQGGSGALEPLNVNRVATGTDSNIATRDIDITGNVDAGATGITTAVIPNAPIAGQATGTAVRYNDLNDAAEFSTVVEVFDSLGQSHTMTFFFYRVTDAAGGEEYQVRAYVDSEDVDTAGANTGFPRQVTINGGAAADGTIALDFGTDGNRVATGNPDISVRVPWNNGSAPSDIDITFPNFTQFASASNILSISQDGQGVGSVSSLSVQENGDVFAILTNGQTTVVGTVGLVNFSNPEGLVRIGSQLLQQSPDSGEPIAGRPNSGTFGQLSAGSIELSTVDIANEFVKLITLQRGFQANSRIITTINQLLNEIIQLA